MITVKMLAQEDDFMCQILWKVLESRQSYCNWKGAVFLAHPVDIQYHHTSGLEPTTLKKLLQCLSYASKAVHYGNVWTRTFFDVCLPVFFGINPDSQTDRQTDRQSVP